MEQFFPIFSLVLSIVALIMVATIPRPDYGDDLDRVNGRLDDLTERLDQLPPPKKRNSKGQFVSGAKKK